MEKRYCQERITKTIFKDITKSSKEYLRKGQTAVAKMKQSQREKRLPNLLSERRFVYNLLGPGYLPNPNQILSHC